MLLVFIVIFCLFVLLLVNIGVIMKKRVMIWNIRVRGILYGFDVKWLNWWIF